MVAHSIKRALMLLFINRLSFSLSFIAAAQNAVKTSTDFAYNPVAFVVYKIWCSAKAWLELSTKVKPKSFAIA